MSKFDITPATLLEGFEDVNDWTVTGGTAEDDTTFTNQGTQSLKLTSGVGTNCIATKTISVNLLSIKQHYFYVYVPSLAEVASIQVILSPTTDFASYYSKTFSASALHEGWNRLPMGRSTWASTGSPSWSTTMVRLRVRVNANTDETAVVYFDGMYYGYETRPKCVISFDDGWSSQYTEGFAYMKKYGFKGSLYLIKNRVENGTLGYLTKPQVQAMYDAGWNVMNHTTDHPNMATELSTQAEVEAELSECRDWIIENGWSRESSELHVAYPNGGYDTKVLAAMASLNMITGRSIINKTQAHEIDNQYLLVRQSHAYTASQSTYRAYIDRAIYEGGVIQLNYHKIVADGAGAADTEVEQAQFRDMMDYLDQMRPYIDVVTHLEWYRGLTHARSIV